MKPMIAKLIPKLTQLSLDMATSKNGKDKGGLQRKPIQAQRQGRQIAPAPVGDACTADALHDRNRSDYHPARSRTRRREDRKSHDYRHMAPAPRRTGSTRQYSRHLD